MTRGRNDRNDAVHVAAGVVAKPKGNFEFTLNLRIQTLYERGQPSVIRVDQRQDVLRRKRPSISKYIEKIIAKQIILVCNDTPT